MQKSKKDLSIVIVNYNTKELTLNCIDSILKNSRDLTYEIIVVDNGSTEQLIIDNSKVTIIKNKENLGFAAGNNKAREYCHGNYVLFLNSDTLVHEGTLAKSLEYMKGHSEIGALGCKTVLPNGQLDKDARRSFPTPWVALTHFSGLDRIFPASKTFARYWYGYKSADQISDVDVIQGAYCMVRRDLLDKIDWYNESYFLDGEDIDLCFRIKEAGYKVVYYPEVYITHIKKASKNNAKGKFAGAGVDAMEIFYRKRMWSRYPFIVNWLVILGIKVLKALRNI
jgi:GT2 family glycosyltransferase